MAEEKKCTGRCEMCSPNQRTYCAAQKMYYLEQDMAEIKNLLVSGAKKDEITTIVTKENVELEDE